MSSICLRLCAFPRLSLKGIRPYWICCFQGVLGKWRILTHTHTQLAQTWLFYACPNKLVGPCRQPVDFFGPSRCFANGFTGFGAGRVSKIRLYCLTSTAVCVFADLAPFLVLTFKSRHLPPSPRSTAEEASTFLTTLLTKNWVFQDFPFKGHSQFFWASKG